MFGVVVLAGLVAFGQDDKSRGINRTDLPETKVYLVYNTKVITTALPDDVVNVSVSLQQNCMLTVWRGDLRGQVECGQTSKFQPLPKVSGILVPLDATGRAYAFLLSAPWNMPDEQWADLVRIRAAHTAAKK